MRENPPSSKQERRDEKESKEGRATSARVRGYFDVHPDRDSRLTLSPTAKNRWGDPLPVVRHEIDASSEARQWRLIPQSPYRSTSIVHSPSHMITNNGVPTFTKSENR